MGSSNRDRESHCNTLYLSALELPTLLTRTSRDPMSMPTNRVVVRRKIWRQAKDDFDGDIVWAGMEPCSGRMELVHLHLGHQTRLVKNAGRRIDPTVTTGTSSEKSYVNHLDERANAIALEWSAREPALAPSDVNRWRSRGPDSPRFR